MLRACGRIFVGRLLALAMKSLHPFSRIPEGSSGMLRRAALLGALLLVAALLYVAVFTVLYGVAPNTEREFTEAGSEPPLNIYVTLVDMDPVREELLVHLDFGTIEGPHGAHYPGVPPRDMIVHVGDGDSVQDITLQAQRSAAPVTLRVSLRGSVGDYPFDRYDGRISVSTSETAEEGAHQAVHLMVWPVLSNWTVDAVRANLVPANGVDLNVHITRPSSFVVIAIAVYTAMAMVGLSGLTIGGLVFLGIRRIEATLTGTLAAMVFAVPALRGALPGVPPLGGHADVLVFVWVELAVILGLTLYVITWARRGPSPRDLDRHD
jgi:Domain of unknown function (DUF4436)